MADKERIKFLTDIFNQLQNKFKEAKHPLSEHYWRKGKAESFRQISVVPMNEAEYKNHNDYKGVHYEILLVENILTFEIHHENKTKRNEFDVLIKKLVNKYPEKYKLWEWNSGAGKGFKKILNSEGVNISDNNVVNKLFNIMKETYEDLHTDIEDYYNNIYLKEKEAEMKNKTIEIEFPKSFFDYPQFYKNFIKELDIPNSVKTVNVIFKEKTYSNLALGKSETDEGRIYFTKEKASEFIKNNPNLKGGEKIKIIVEYNCKTHIPLNQILYGPPGTGKTYNTINKAIKIINPEFDTEQDRETVKKEYDRLTDVGQIVFTTFHQSMSYEDFIEGIKPKMNEAKKNVEYEIKDGIFKKISKNALLNIVNKNNKTNIYTFDKLWSDFLEHIKPFENKDEFIFKTITEKGLKLVEIKDWGNIFVQFEYNAKKNNSKASAVLTANKNKIKNLFENNIIPSEVKSLKKEIKPIIKSHETLHFAVYQKFWDFANKKLEETGSVTEKEINFNDIFNEIKSFKKDEILQEKINDSDNFVLIIDEINRGNVSSIFGELITLIEEDKRIGKDEELKATLPYSKDEKFGVPPNLYIIGTMNTADRSVEALDTALRRRFVFEEMPPKPEIIKTKGKAENGKITIKNTEINLVKLLKIINQRIEILLDGDHLIGHSYFMNVENEYDLKKSFSKQIIPLLQEYFYGDYGKIALVLGEGFCKAKQIGTIKDIFANVSDYETDAFEDKVIYEIAKIDDDFDILNAVTILFNRKDEQSSND